MGTIETLQIPECETISELTDLAAMPAPRLDKPMRVLFVCTGNTCRSPMAAAALNALGCGRYAAESAGIFAQAGMPISRYAEQALGEAGIESTPQNNYKAHKARQVTEEPVAAADRVIALTEPHMLVLMRSYPQYAAKITVMKRDIADPYGGTLEDYKRCLAEIIDCLREMFPLDREK
ncbi:MAG: low molecular weight protein arginine phosphatase [Clostridiales bacterium]|jgi:protein-tyrosine-phosphatase|nr:low molecular weight protein arginine phosphatase [Clostridiales bacterium]